MRSSRSGRQLGTAVLSTLLLSALAACGGGGGGGGGNGGGTVPPPAPILSRLTLTGTVTDAPIANAVVTATIGSQTFTATADANGNYSVEIAIEESATAGFITLTAKGAGSQSYVEFTSLAGMFSALKTQAGSDSILSNSENFATQITNVSTALAVLLQQANNGQPVTSQTLIDTLSPTLNGQQVLELAAAIKLLVDEADDYPMPSGQTSMQALLANTTVREQLVADFYEQDPTTFKNTQNAIVGDSTLTQPVTTATLPASLMAASLTDNDGPTYGDSDRAVAYTFNSNGTGTAASGTWHRNMTWSISGGSVDVVYDNAVVDQLGVYTAICPELDGDYSPVGYPEFYNVAGAKLTLLSGGVLATTETRQITSRDCGPYPVTEVVTIARTVLNADDFLPIDIAELRDSTRTLWVYNTPYDQLGYPTVSIMPDVAELHANGTGSTLTFGKQFTWSLDSSGRVVEVTFDDGVTAKFRSVRELDDVATDVLYEFTLPTGRRVDAGPSLQVDPQLAFTRENVTGHHYRYGIGGGPDVPGSKGFRYRFAADGSGASEFEMVDSGGNLVVQDGLDYRWEIEGDDLTLQYTRPDNCDLIEPSCVLYRDARIIPIARDGARTYWFGSWRYGQPLISDGFMRQNLIAYYDYEPFDAPAVVNGKTSLAGKDSERKLRFREATKH